MTWRIMSHGGQCLAAFFVKMSGLLWPVLRIISIYLPKGSPYLNAVEECWHQGKRILLVSEYYRTFADMCNAIITYYRNREV